jgi:hypothetical protein
VLSENELGIFKKFGRDGFASSTRAYIVFSLSLDRVSSTIGVIKKDLLDDVTHKMGQSRDR